MFAFDSYYTLTFVYPIGTLLLGGAVLCGASFGLVRHVISKTMNVVNIISYIVVWLVVGGISFLAVTDIINGGMAVAQERETDALTAHGYVRNIESPSGRILWFKSQGSRGADIVINGEQYFVASAGDFEEGDYVAIRYLPKSRFILRMVAVSEDNKAELARVLEALRIPDAETVARSQKSLMQKIWGYRIYIFLFLWTCFVVVTNNRKRKYQRWR